MTWGQEDRGECESKGERDLIGGEMRKEKREKGSREK